MTTVALSEKEKSENQKAQNKSKSVGVSPWTNYSAMNTDIVPKLGKWDQYYQMYRHHSMVRAAIDKIAKTATNVGFDFVPRDSRARIRQNELNILQKFFGNQRDFIYELRRIYKDLLIYGDAFMYVVPDKARRAHSLKRLPPNTIAIRASDNGRVKGYVQFDPNDPTHQKYTTFQEHEILHFRIDDPDNDLYGLSPLQSLEWAVTADIYAQRYNAAFFQNSGITGTIISVSGVDPDEIERNRKFLMENYTGPDAAHKPVFLEGQNVSVEKAVNTHHDMGFLEGRKFIILEILAVLDVPPAKVGIMESANRSNSKEQDKTFRSESVSPLQYIVESVINAQFIQPILGVSNTIFVHSEGDTRDAVELMDYYTKGMGWGIFNANEIRSKMGMGNVEGGDINGIMTPTGFVPLDRLNLYFQIPKQNTEDIPTVPEDPPEGEEAPKPTPATEVATGVSREAVKAMQSRYDSARQGMMTLLESEKPDQRQLAKAYTYFVDAQGVDPAFDQIGTLLEKSIHTTNDILQEGYFGRIQDTFNDWIERKQGEHGGPSSREQLI